MTTITREQLRERAREKVKSLEFAVTQTAFAENRAELEEELELARIALASLTAEPVAWTDADELRDAKNSGIGYLFAIGGDANKFADPRRQIILFTAPPAPPVPGEWKQWIVDAVEYLEGGLEADGELEAEGSIEAKRLLSRRAAMLQGSQPVSNRDELSSPAIPDGYVLVPKRLTAENFAKAALSGEFSETKFINCPECFGDDECETCDGSGRIEIIVPVTWTTIKAIWSKGVEHFATAKLKEVG